MGPILDAIRCAKLGLERGLKGPLEEPSAYYMKSPPRQMGDSVARERTEAFIRGSAALEGDGERLEHNVAGD